MSAIQKALDAAAKRRQVHDEAHDHPRRSMLARTAKDLASIVKDLVPARVQRNVMERNKILPAVADRTAITAYKMLRTRVLQRMRSNRWQTMIVTSSAPGEGKTLTASNLAVSMSSDMNHSIILVDLDLQRPCLSSYFGLDVKAGLGDYLLGKVPIEDVVYAPRGLENLAIIPSREPMENSSDLLSSPRMRELLRWIKEQGPATIAVFDMPPVLACDDVLAFLPSADALLMVVAEGATERAALARTMEMLGECNLLGVVLNRSRERNAVSSYYY
jgi:protein-tyrosine kinase